MDNCVHPLFSKFISNERSTRSIFKCKNSSVRTQFGFTSFCFNQYVLQVMWHCFYFNLFTCHMVIKNLCSTRFYLTLGDKHNQSAFWIQFRRKNNSTALMLYGHRKLVNVHCYFHQSYGIAPILRRICTRLDWHMCTYIYCSSVIPCVWAWHNLIDPVT